jgi:hypothetical protein
VKIEDHVEKAERIGGLRSRLDPADDYELWYWASLSASINLFNAALHHLGATVAEDCFAHNLPVYIRPGATAGTFEAVIRPFGDLEHVEGEEVEGLIPPRLALAAAALRELEAVRDPGIRGDMAITPALSDGVEAAYLRVLGITRFILDGEAESGP